MDFMLAMMVTLFVTCKKDESGSMIFDTDGDYWKESGIFANPSNICQNTGTDMMGVDGKDLSAWCADPDFR
jgi:hypothetical protein